MLSCCLGRVDCFSLPSELVIYLSFSPLFLFLLVLCRRGRSQERVNHVYVTEARAVLMLMKADILRTPCPYRLMLFKRRCPNGEETNGIESRDLCKETPPQRFSLFLDYTLSCIFVCTCSLDYVFNLHPRVDNCYSICADNVSAVFLRVGPHLITVQAHPSGPTGLCPQQGAVRLAHIMSIQSLCDADYQCFPQLLLSDNTPKSEMANKSAVCNPSC